MVCEDPNIRCDQFEDVSPLMHSAIMIDQHRFRFERAWFNRTVVGLVSAGVQVTRIIPESDPDDDRVALTASVEVRSAKLPWLRRASRDRLAARLNSADISLIHAMGMGVWNDAVEVAKMLEVPVVLDVWSKRGLGQIGRFAKSASVAAVFAACEGMAGELRKKIEPGLVCTIPIGVYIPEGDKEVLCSPERGWAAILAGQGVKTNDLANLMDGFTAAHARYPECMLFADLDHKMSARAWDLAKRRGILDSFSLLPSLDQNRRLVMKADLLLVPSATGRSSSFLLEAMASPMVAVMAEDLLVSQPADQRAGVVLREVGSSDWSAALEKILTQHEFGQRLAEGARSWVAQKHAMSVQVSRMYEAYETVLTGGSVRLSS